jgi:hypothetical protein
MISGGDAARWLGEITRWRVDESRLALYLVPTSAIDLSPCALFVIVSGGVTMQVAPSATPYGTLAGAVYLPVDAAILPAVSEPELLKLNRFAILLLHPALGPIGFDEKDRLAVADLISPLPRREEDWETAQPGLSVQPRLLSISIRLPTSLEELFSQSSTDIGSDPVSLDEKPVGKDPAKLIEKGWEGLQGGMLAGLSRFFASLPHRGRQRTAINEMEDWVNAKLKGLTADVQARREESLRELLEELESSPDEALKHALPLNMLGAHRGMAPPSPTLGSNTPDFSMNLLGGGKRLDLWNLSPQTQAQLRTKYLKLVERERQLGRYRRAAYIYAKLLGNISGAAMVLREGGFYQEAAILYRDHLKSPVVAGECFAQAGLNEEAENLFKLHKAWPQLTQLYLTIGEKEKERQAYRDWVQDLKTQGDYIKAAEFLRANLHDHDAAYALLESAWPAHRQALLCAKKYIEWRGTAGEHAATKRFLQQRQTATHGAQADLLWLDLLVQTRSSYPDRDVQHLAEDFGRLKIAHKFRALYEPAEMQKYVSVLVRLAPEDHLLRRDAFRHLDQARARAAKTARPRPTHTPGKEVPVELVREFKFPQVGVTWIEARSTGDHFFATATGGIQERPPTVPSRELCFVRSNFEGAQQTILWMVPCTANKMTPTFSCWGEKRSFDRVFLFQPAGQVCPVRTMPVADAFPVPVTVLDSPAPIHEVLASAFSPGGMLWLCRWAGTGLHLTSYTRERTVVSDMHLTLPPTIDYRSPCLVVMENHIALSVEYVLYICSSSEGLKMNLNFAEEFESPIIALVACPRWTKPHIAVVMESKVALTWFAGAAATSYVVETGLEKPLVTFTKDGILVVVSAHGGQLFDCDTKGVKASNSFSLEGHVPVAVMPGPEVRTFATLDATGKVRIFRCSRAIFRS